MVERVYFKEDAKGESRKAEKLITDIFIYYMNNTNEITNIKETEDKEEIVKDYIAGMTDRFAINTFNRLFMPEPWDR